MKKLLVLSAIAAFAVACGGSDNKPANDPSTNSGTTPAEAPTTEAAPAPAESTPAAPTDGEKPAEGTPANK